MTDEELVRAAGGIVVRDGAVLMIHRPEYDDWSLPKGKLDADESPEDAAVREVEEETGLRCSLGAFVGTVGYEDRRGRPKTVDYWEMTPPTSGEGSLPFEANDEVDELRWVTPEEALGLMTYDRDRQILARWLER